MKSLFKYNLYHFLISPVFFFTNALYVIFAAIYFFLSSRFFTAAGTSDLQGFFLILSTLNILYFPLLVSFNPFCQTDLTLPYGHFTIVFSKLLTAFTACLFTIFTSMLIPFAVSRFGSLDKPALICSIIVLIFYSLAGLSFTLFISAFFTSPALSFALSSLVLIITNIIHLIPAYTSFTYSSALLNYFSLAWHFDAAGKGIADSSDILFFIIITIASLIFTVIILDYRRQALNRILKHKIAAPLISVILLLILSSHIVIRKDFTTNGKYTFSQLTIDTASSVSQPLYITYYRSQALLERYPALKDTEFLLQEWASLNKKIFLKLKDTSSAKTRTLLQKEGIPSQTINLDSSDNSIASVYSAIVMEYAGERKIIPFLIDPSTLEYDLTKNTTDLISKRNNFVMLVSGNGSRIEENYGNLYSFLEYQGFIPVILYCQSSGQQENNTLSFKEIISSGAMSQTPLVVLGSSEFSKEETDLLEEYILKGGKVFIATQNYTVNTLDGWELIEGNEYFNRMLFTFGIYFDQDPVCSQDSFGLTLQNNNGTYVKQYPLWPSAAKQKSIPEGLIQFWPSAITIDQEVADLEDFNTEAIISLSDKSWHLKSYDNQYITNPYTDFTPDEKFFTPVTAVSVKKKGAGQPSLIVYGDQYGFSTPMLRMISSTKPDLRTLNFLSDSLMTLTGREDLNSLKYKFASTANLNKVSLTEREAASKKVYAAMIVIPLFISLAAYLLTLAVRRKLLNEKD
ncbi:Gldg family protein [Treponema sp.]|uniref:Gldg family protein n=1 Tax=Treponema sp. TaxID=166 RepID=UPI0025ED456B|nr:Gldg family protein [Treponema sp.]MCR5217978.1 Gldg family protein [Treponema sp.]